DEDLRQREPLVCQIVIGEGAGLVAVVEKHDPPRTGGRRLMLRNKGELRGPDTPDRVEVLVPLLIEGRQHLLYVTIGNGRRVVDNGDLQHLTLPGHFGGEICASASGERRMPNPAAIKQGRRPLSFWDTAATPQRGTALFK